MVFSYSYCWIGPGTEFEGAVLQEICNMLNIDKIRAISYKPSTKVH